MHGCRNRECERSAPQAGHYCETAFGNSHVRLDHWNEIVILLEHYVAYRRLATALLPGIVMVLQTAYKSKAGTEFRPCPPCLKLWRFRSLHAPRAAFSSSWR